MTLDFDALLLAESERFREVMAATNPAVQVPTCPDWNADDLLWHLGEVQHFWAAIVGERMEDPAAYSEPDRPADRDGLLGFFDEASESLRDALDGAPDGDRAWSWFAADQTVGFTRRRQVHEALIHRIDAELAAGLDSVIEPELAADGVQEMLEIMFGGAPDWSSVKAAGPVGEVRATDVDRRWLVQVQSFSGTSPNTGTVYSGEPVIALVDAGQATFGVSGAAADLDRWFWSRHPTGQITRTGDAAGLDSLVEQGLQ